MYASLYRLPQSSDHTAAADAAASSLTAIARDFSPRYELHGDDVVVIDVGGLERLLGPAKTIGVELQRTASARGLRANVAIAGTQTAARLLSRACPGLTVIERGGEAAALAKLEVGRLKSELHTSLQTSDFQLQTFQRWGVRTLGELAALLAADLVARLGPAALGWQALARGEDRRPLIPALDDERFESTLELEWPIEGLEPLSFVLTRLLEPLSTRLERRDRGAAVLHVLLGLVNDALFARRLELPTPLRDVRALRTLALLDLEAHPPAAAVDRVTIVIDPTPGRVLQHTLFTRAHPTPEQLSTLVARLGALMGQDRIGAPATVDTDRPGAFAMTPYAMEHRRVASPEPRPSAEPRAPSRGAITSALRRCRQPIPARVAVAGDRLVRVTSDRRGFAGGAVVRCAGPWRTSGHWWVAESWDRDEWDVALGDGAVYRIFRDRESDGWFIEAIVD